MSLLNEEKKNLYIKYLSMHYVENSHIAVWCPAPGCDFCIENEYYTQ